MSELELQLRSTDRLVRNGALAAVLAVAAGLVGVGMTFYAPGVGAEPGQAAVAPAGSPEFRQDGDRSSPGARTADVRRQGEGADLSNTYADVSARR
ncbi:MAG: hypothetical protein ACK4N5_15930 [Myxococcales bacterium]